MLAQLAGDAENAPGVRRRRPRGSLVQIAGNPVGRRDHSPSNTAHVPGVYLGLGLGLGPRSVSCRYRACTRKYQRRNQRLQRLAPAAYGKGGLGVLEGSNLSVPLIYICIVRDTMFFNNQTVDSNPSNTPIHLPARAPRHCHGNPCSRLLRRQLFGGSPSGLDFHRRSRGLLSLLPFGRPVYALQALRHRPRGCTPALHRRAKADAVAIQIAA